MSDPLTQEPTRLLDDPDVELGLRHDLELARSHSSVAYSVDAGLARFEQTIHGVSTVPPGGSVSGLRVLGWFVGAVALLGGVGYLMLAPPREATGMIAADPSVAAQTEQPDRSEQQVHGQRSGAGGPDTAVEDRAHDSIEHPGPADPGPAGILAEPTDSARVASTTPKQPSSKSVAKPTPAPEPTASLADEAAQVNAARKALAKDPAETLALMEAAEQQFPAGSMLQERRGYTILALVALGRTADAEPRADAYLERWPNGPLSRRVRDALGR